MPPRNGNTIMVNHAFAINEGLRAANHTADELANMNTYLVPVVYGQTTGPDYAVASDHATYATADNSATYSNPSFEHHVYAEPGAAPRQQEYQPAAGQAAPVYDSFQPGHFTPPQPQHQPYATQGVFYADAMVNPEHGYAPFRDTGNLHQAERHAQAGSTSAQMAPMYEYATHTNQPHTAIRMRDTQFTGPLLQITLPPTIALESIVTPLCDSITRPGESNTDGQLYQQPTGNTLIDAATKLLKHPDITALRHTEQAEIRNGIFALAGLLQAWSLPSTAIQPFPFLDNFELMPILEATQPAIEDIITTNGYVAPQSAQLQKPVIEATIAALQQHTQPDSHHRTSYKAGLVTGHTLSKLGIPHDVDLMHQAVRFVTATLAHEMLHYPLASHGITENQWERHIQPKLANICRSTNICDQTFAMLTALLVNAQHTADFSQNNVDLALFIDPRNKNHLIAITALPMPHSHSTITPDGIHLANTPLPTKMPTLARYTMIPQQGDHEPDATIMVDLAPVFHRSALNIDHRGVGRSTIDEAIIKQIIGRTKKSSRQACPATTMSWATSHPRQAALILIIAAVTIYIMVARLTQSWPFGSTNDDPQFNPNQDLSGDQSPTALAIVATSQQPWTSVTETMTSTAASNQTITPAPNTQPPSSLLATPGSTLNTLMVMASTVFQRVFTTPTPSTLSTFGARPTLPTKHITQSEGIITTAATPEESNHNSTPFVDSTPAIASAEHGTYDPRMLRNVSANNATLNANTTPANAPSTASGTHTNTGTKTHTDTDTSSTISSKTGTSISSSTASSITAKATEDCAADEPVCCIQAYGPPNVATCQKVPETSNCIDGLGC